MHSTVVLDRSFLAKFLPSLYWIVRSCRDVSRFIGIFVFKLFGPSMFMGVSNSPAVRIFMALTEVKGVNPTRCL